MHELRNPTATLDRDVTVEKNQDADQLRLLSVFHYVVAGILGLCSLFPLIHLAVGIAIVTGAFDQGHGAVSPPELIGWLFIVIPLFAIVMGLTLATCMAVAGRFIDRRTRYHYCLVVAGLECLFMPFGTVLGIFTIVVLMRPSVKLLFGVPTEPIQNDNIRC